MENNPWYNENQAWMHTDPDAHLRDMQTRWYQQQEDQRLIQLDRAAHGGDFARLQGVSQQFAPQQQHHQGGGVPWGGLAVGAAAGYYLANRAQQQPEPQVVHPEGWKSSVIGWYIAAAFVVHFGLFLFATPYDTGGATFWLIGMFVWIPAWVAGFAHQSHVSLHNASLAEPAVEAPVAQDGPSFLEKWRGDLRQDASDQN